MKEGYKGIIVMFIVMIACFFGGLSVRLLHSNIDNRSQDIEYQIIFAQKGDYR